MTEGIKKVNKVCKAIQKLDDLDLQEVVDMAKTQIDYIHPLKNSTAIRTNKLGNRNLKIAKKIIELKKILNNN